MCHEPDRVTFVSCDCTPSESAPAASLLSADNASGVGHLNEGNGAISSYSETDWSVNQEGLGDVYDCEPTPSASGCLTKGNELGSTDSRYSGKISDLKKLGVPAVKLLGNGAIRANGIVFDQHRTVAGNVRHAQKVAEYALANYPMSLRRAMVVNPALREAK